MCRCSGIKGEADEIPRGDLPEVATHEQSPQVEMIRKGLPGGGISICKGIVMEKNIRPLRNLEKFILRFVLRHSQHCRELLLKVPSQTAGFLHLCLPPLLGHSPPTLCPFPSLSLFLTPYCLNSSQAAQDALASHENP